MPDCPRVTLKPNFSSWAVRYFEVSTSCMPSSPKLNTEWTSSCASLDISSTPLTASCLYAASFGLSWAAAPPGNETASANTVDTKVRFIESSGTASATINLQSATAEPTGPQTGRHVREW